jgi:ankyrin repeat protein
MSDFIEICPQCGKVFFEVQENCSCGGSFGLTEIKARREKWLKSMKKDGFLTAALKTVAEADFSQIDSNLVQAVLRCGDFEALKKIVASGYDNWDMPELLMAAIKAPFPEIMAFLKAQEVDYESFFKRLTSGEYYAVCEKTAPAAPAPVDTKKASENLRKAVIYGNIKKAEYWLKNGADVNYLSPSEAAGKKESWYSENDLPMIVHVRSVKMAELLISQGAKLNDWRILHYIAGFSSRSDLVRYLVEHGAKYCVDDPERNLLTEAACYGDLKLFKYIHNLGFDLNNGLNRQGKTPLRIAAEHANSEIIEYLLQNEAKTNIGDKKSGPFYLEISGNDDKEMLKSLKVLTKFNIDIRHCELLDRAAYRGNLQSARYLLENNCPVETVCCDGKSISTFPLRSLIWLSVPNNALEMIDLLLAHGASINGVYQYGGSPLRSAITGVSPEIVEKLLQHGADPNLQDNGGRPLLIETLYQKPQTKVLKIVKLLVEHGADTQGTYSGNTPMQLARNREYPKVVEYFKSLGLKR